MSTIELLELIADRGETIQVRTEDYIRTDRHVYRVSVEMRERRWYTAERIEAVRP